MARPEEIWLPLVDEPIRSVLAELERTDPELGRLVGSPRALLAFRTFAHIRAGLVCGELLVEHDLDEGNGSETWVERLVRTPEHRARIEREVKLVAAEIAADPRYGADVPLGPDPAARERFRSFARIRLEKL